MTLLVVIVNYRTTDMTLQVIRHIVSQISSIDSRVLVVDNDSRDGSFEALSKAVVDEGFSDRVSVIASDKNGGFGYGINVGVRWGLELPDPPRFFYILNPDAFPDPGAVDRLIEQLDKSPEVGISGSYVHGMDGERQGPAFRFPTVMSEFETTMRFAPVTWLLKPWTIAHDPGRDCDVDWVSGASLMIRREVFETVGLFDEGFFLYYEEIDFCHRVHKAGFRIVYVASSTISHVGSVSTGMQNFSKPMPEYWFASRRRYFQKHHGSAYLAACDLVWTTGFSLWRIRRKLQRKPDTDRPGMLRDFVRYNFPRSFVPKIAAPSTASETKPS